MNRLIVLILLGAVCVTPSLAGAVPARDGGSGLVLMRTADVIESGSVEMHVGGWAEIFRVPGTTDRDVEGTVSGGIAVGLGDFFEIGVFSPALVYSDATVTGWRNLRGVAKLRLLGSRDAGFGVAITGFGDVDTSSSKKNVEAEERSFGTEMNVSIFGEQVSVHLSGGYEESRTRLDTPVVTYGIGKKITGAFGIEIRPLPEFSISLEAVGHHGTEDAGDDFFLVPGIRYSPNEYVTYTIGASYAVPDDRSEPEFMYLASMTIGFGRTRWESRPFVARLDEQQQRIRSMEESIARVEQSTQEKVAGIEQRVEDLAAAEGERGEMVPAGETIADDVLKQHVDDLNKRVTALEQKRSPAPVAEIAVEEEQPESDARPRVEVINESGDKGIARRVGEMLRSKGIHVIWIGDEPGAVREKSTIYYRDGFAQDAVRIGHLIPENQIVVRSEHLDPDIDVRIVAGKDLRGYR